MKPIYQGDSKSAIIEVLIEGVDDISTWTSKILVVPGVPLKRDLAAALAVDCSGVDATHVKMEIPTTETAKLSPGSYSLLLRIANADGTKRLSKEIDSLVINPDPEAAE